MPGTRGTGHLARDVAAWLSSDYPIAGISRHQLLYDRRIPFTANNSSNVIRLEAPESARLSIFERVAEFVPPQCPEGSDPGLCVATQEQADGLSFGRQCQVEVVKVSLAVDTAASRDILLKEDGMEVHEGDIETNDKVRPALRNGRVTLYVRPIAPGVWEALKV
ncbi:MAG: hypothetical protein BWY09_01754 [Candidatus Hydrogenedentes bacterium ADurb.Bin179]|nr:MAG: hypothetical protein BWY09_01754 [Candidatus Hydrogenedentes bacterium ADurb.Bin179]